MGGLTVNVEQPRPRRVTVDKRLWLTADQSELVEDGDERAAFLFCIPNRPIKYEDAVKYGLVKESKPSHTKEVRKEEKETKSAADDELTCDECGAGPFKNASGLSNHRRAKHE